MGWCREAPQGGGRGFCLQGTLQERMPIRAAPHAPARPRRARLQPSRRLSHLSRSRMAEDNRGHTVTLLIAFLSLSFLSPKGLVFYVPELHGFSVCRTGPCWGLGLLLLSFRLQRFPLLLAVTRWDAWSLSSALVSLAVGRRGTVSLASPLFHVEQNRCEFKNGTMHERWRGQS